MNTQNSPQLICMLGMHRSGTSAVSRLLNLLGVYLGPEPQIIPPAPDNPKGFWEHHILTSINDEILARLGGSWHEPPVFTPGWETSPNLADLRQRARAVFQEDFGGTELWGWKDPRTCLTLAFWQKLLPQLRYVICLRNPLDVARSLERRNAFPLEKGVRLWLMHMASALQHTMGYPRLLVFYEDIMEDWPHELRRLASFLGVPEPTGQTEVLKAAQEFLDEELQHHRTQTIDVVDEPQVTFPAKALYWVLRIYRAGSFVEGRDLHLERVIDLFSTYAWEAQASQENLSQLVTVLREQLQAAKAALEGQASRLQTQPTEREQILASISSSKAELEAALAERQAQVEGLEGQVGSLQRIIAERDTQFVALQNLEGEVSRLQTQLTEREQILASISSSKAELEAALAERQAQAEELVRQVGPLQKTVAKRDAQIVALENKAAQQAGQMAFLSARLDELHRSLSWRMTQPLRVLRSWQMSLIRGRRARRYSLTSGPSVEQLETPGIWRSRDDDPWVLLNEPVPGGWVEIAYKMSCQGVPRGSVYVDTGSGFSESQRIWLPLPVRGEVRTVLSLPHHVHRLRIDPVDRPGMFQFESITLRPLGTLQLVWRGLALAARKLLRRPDLFCTAYERVRRGGLQAIIDYAIARGTHLNGDPDEYASWVVEYDAITEADRDAIRDHIQMLPRKPRISVIMPVYQTKERYLRVAIESVRRQLYPHWQLCIADDASLDPRVRRILKEYSDLDARINVVFRPARGGISAASNSALELATGDFVALLDHDDEISEHGLYMVAFEINEHPDAGLIYSDEDKIDQRDRRSDPYFKSDWNPDLFYGHNMICHLGAYRTDIVREIGGFRSEYDGSQDYDLALRVIERIALEQIRHIPHVLYHWRRTEGSTALRQREKPYAHEAARRALQSYFDRNGIRARSVAARDNSYYHRALFAMPSEVPLVTVIVPTRNGKGLLERAVAGVRRARYSRVELIIVNNRSDDRETLAYLGELESAGVRILAYNQPYNWSAINNFAASHARGDVLLFLNNDVEPLDDEWLEEMVRHAVRSDVGIAGAALYYPDGRLQHGGVILGVGGVAGHAHLGLPMGHPGYMSRALLAQDLSAVTGACMATRRDVFFEVGGLDTEHLPVALNDIDYCLRVREKGYLVVWTPYARLYHREGATRGRDDTPDASPRFAQECAYMRRQWGHLLAADPYYNPNLALDRPDFSLAWPPRATKPWKTCMGSPGPAVLLGSAPR